MQAVFEARVEGAAGRVAWYCQGVQLHNGHGCIVSDQLTSAASVYCSAGMLPSIIVAKPMKKCTFRARQQGELFRASCSASHYRLGEVYLFSPVLADQIEVEKGTFNFIPRMGTSSVTRRY